MKFISTCLLFILLFTTATPIYAQDEKQYNPTDWSDKNRIPFRSEILSCDVFFSPLDPGMKRVSDGAAVRISSNNIEDFRKAFLQMMDIKGKDAIEKGRIYITGVKMGEKAETKKLFREALNEMGAPENVQIRGLTVPAHLVDEGATNLFKNSLQDFIYQFPGYERNYQIPLINEVKGGFAGMAPIEIPNTVILYSTVPFLPGHTFMDVHITAFNHGVILAIYNVYQKFMLNWLLMPGETYAEKKMREKLIVLGEWMAKKFTPENLRNPTKLHKLLGEKFPAWTKKFDLAGTRLFAKQMELSLPFIMNFKLAGNFTALSEYFSKQGFPDWMTIMHESGSFIMTDGLTVGLQTYFYKVTQTQKIGSWLMSVSDEKVKGLNGIKKSDLAREFVNYVKIPILVLDAAILFFASNGYLPIESFLIETSLGDFQPNMFQAALVGLTAVGKIWYSEAYLSRKFSRFEAKARLKESRKTDPDFLKDRKTSVVSKVVRRSKIEGSKMLETTDRISTNAWEYFKKLTGLGNSNELPKLN
mgnify:CR=1 FL=1